MTTENTQNTGYSLEEAEMFTEHLEKHLADGQLKLIEKVINFLKEIKEDPKKGTGKPESLKGYGERDVWSRRINDKHRLVYEIFKEEKKVTLLSAYAHYNEKKKDKKKLF